MHPDLFSIGFLHLRTYGCCMALGFLAAWHLIAWLCRKTNRAAEPLSNLLVGLMISGVVGSRIAYVIEHWQSEFAAEPWQIIRVDQGGLMFYGGFILAMCVFFGWCYWHKESPRRLADLFTVAIPLAHAFGRVGCFFYGCCHGRVSNAAWAVSFPHGSPAWYAQVRQGLITAEAPRALPVLPTQLVEAACCLAMAGILTFVYKRNYARHPGLTAGCYMIGYAAVRYLVEILRGDVRAQVGCFSISQAISLALALVGSIFIFSAYRSKSTK